MIDKSYVEKLTARLSVIESELSDPSTAANQRRYQSLLVEHSHLRDLNAKAMKYFGLVQELEDSRVMFAAPDSDSELKEMAQAEIARVEKFLPSAEHDLMMALLPPDPADSRNTILEIRAGTGGEEAALFAGDLYRMYSRFAERQGWKVGLIDASPSTMGGYKEIIFGVEGKDVYRTLKYESGGHRVQRIPITEANGRIHTSAATVAVLPEATEIDEIEVKPDEIRIDLYRASGPGGQKVNKTESAVRITHMPSGIVVQSQDERSQQRNRERAMSVLKARLLDRARNEEQAKMASERKSQIGSGDRSERIRTYNFPQNRVTDHRIEMTLYTLDRFMEGEIDQLVTVLRERDTELRLQQQMKS
jgi:peptide chain release factor 1